jgi:inner membrane protein
MVVAAEIPDIDVLWYFKNPVSGFAHHRGFTHTFLGVPFDAALTLVIIYLYWLARGKRKMAREIDDGSHLPWQQPRWGILFGFACIAGLSHLLLDYTNDYGLRPLDPLNWHWYSWDIVFIVEPVMTIVLIVGLLIPPLFRLINEEIESHEERRRPGGRGGAVFGLVCVLLLWGFRDFEHRGALAQMQTQLYQGAEPLRMSAIPEMVDLFHWHGVVETRNFFALFPVNSWTHEVDPHGEIQIFYKPEETPVTLAAKRSYLGRVYLDWAQYPMTEVEERAAPLGGYTVRIFDLRFYTPGRSPRRLGAVVELDRNLHVVDEYFESSRRASD